MPRRLPRDGGLDSHGPIVPDAVAVQEQLTEPSEARQARGDSRGPRVAYGVVAAAGGGVPGKGRRKGREGVNG